MNFTDGDVFEPDFVTMILEEDLSCCDFAKLRVFVEFALLKRFFPFAGAGPNVENEFAVEPVLDVPAVDDDASVVEFVRRKELFVVSSRKHVVKITGAMFVDFSFTRLGIIKNLVLAAEPFAVEIVEFVFDAAVATGLDFPMKIEDEILVNLFRDDVAPFSAAVDHPIDRFPGLDVGFAPHGRPTGQILTVEKRDFRAGHFLVKISPEQLRLCRFHIRQKQPDN